MGSVSSNDEVTGYMLLSGLHEPNETHLGLSKGVAQGRAMGSGLSTGLWKALRESEAARSGLIEDLEDTVLLIEGIGPDVVSDITTNIIRGPLIEYTQLMCSQHGIPMEADVDSGSVWSSTEKKWSNKFVDLPVTEFGKLLLVPKAIVRRRLAYDGDDYYRNYILPALEEAECNRSQGRKKGRRGILRKGSADSLD